MPPLKHIPAASARYYKLHFQDDGFPGQRRDDGSIFEHPLYPRYIVRDYLKQYARRPSAKILKAAALVMNAAMRRAEPFKNSLVFWYDSDANVARASHRHYSGLTQAYYVSALASLARITGKKRYGRFARRFAKSLTIPVGEGGVMQAREQGKGIEELPLSMPDLVLNGWLTALVELLQDRRLIRQSGLKTFINENLDLLEFLLPRYDIPELNNTRYSLSGFMRLQLHSAQSNIHLRDVRTSWSAHEKYDLGIAGESPWQNYLFPSDVVERPAAVFTSKQKTVRANIVLSQLAEENAFEFVASADTETTLDVTVSVGQYHPLSSAPVAQKWVRIDSLVITPEPRFFHIPVGKNYTNLIGYPTNFNKSFDGINRNVYHPIHAKGLYRLFRYQDRPAFADYARRWTRYMAQWKVDPLYTGLDAYDYAARIPRGLRKVYTEALDGSRIPPVGTA